MSTFTELKIGRVPITEEGVDRYRISDSILNHFTELSSLEDLNTSVGRIWTEMKVPLPWLQICTANYITGTIEFNNPAASSLEVRGWIDSVEPLSDSVGVPTCRVRWHFDFWEMYKVVASYDYGQVKRRPFVDLGTTPVQNYPYRYRTVGTSYDISGAPAMATGGGWNTKPWWVIWSRGKPDGGKTVFEYYAFPVFPRLDNGMIARIGGDWASSEPCMNLRELMEGGLDYYFSFPPSQVYGIWISPVAPVAGTWSNVTTLSALFVPSTIPTYVTENGRRCMRILAVQNYEESCVKDITSPVTTPFTSTEDEQYAVVGPDGSIAGTVPYGLSVNKIRRGFLLSASEAAIVVQFVNDSTGTAEHPPIYDKGSRADGLMIVVPLPMLPLNENALSEYMYTGQRDYDRTTRQISTNTSAVSNTFTGALGGAIAGGFSSKGALIGAAAGAAGGLINYGVESLYTNDEMIKAEERLRAHQSPGLLFNGDGAFVTETGPGLLLSKIVFDSYSSAQISNTRSNYGVSVDEILSSCDSLIRTTSPTGFYQIPNLIISGPLPVEAKDTIKQKFSSGVRLI